MDVALLREELRRKGYQERQQVRPKPVLLTAVVPKHRDKLVGGAQKKEDSWHKRDDRENGCCNFDVVLHVSRLLTNKLSGRRSRPLERPVIPRRHLAERYQLENSRPRVSLRHVRCRRLFRRPASSMRLCEYERADFSTKPQNKRCNRETSPFEKEPHATRVITINALPLSHQNSAQIASHILKGQAFPAEAQDLLRRPIRGWAAAIALHDG